LTELLQNFLVQLFETRRNSYTFTSASKSPTKSAETAISVGGLRLFSKIPKFPFCCHGVRALGSV